MGHRVTQSLSKNELDLLYVCGNIIPVLHSTVDDRNWLRLVKFKLVCLSLLSKGSLFDVDIH